MLKAEVKVGFQRQQYRDSFQDNLQEFEEFDSLAFRKSAASSIGGASRKPVGLEDFEDFDDINDLSEDLSGSSEKKVN